MSGQDEAEDKDWRRKHWGWVLGIGGAAVVVVFVVLSIDPSVRLHEQVRGLAQWAQPLAGFTPLLIGAVAAAALVVGYRNFRVAREPTQV